MFFGRKETVEPLPLPSLSALLDQLFNKKMQPLEERSQGIIRELHAAHGQFISTCLAFEKLDAEPYTEDIWMPNINAIKSNKAQYAAALTDIASHLDLEADLSMNIYSRYYAILSNVEQMMNSIIRTNSKFKQSFYCYSRYLGGFKKASAYLDRLILLFRSELEKRSAEFAQYNLIKEHISQLKAQGSELEALNEAISALRSNSKSIDNDPVEQIESETKKKLSDKSTELLAIREEASRISSRISLLTAPLERPSRKLDHLALRKKSLHLFLEDPVGTIKDESEYHDFMELLHDLEKNVASGAIESKNPQELSNSISILLNSDIYYLITSLKDLDHKRLEVHAQIRELDRILEELYSGRRSVANAHQQILLMEVEIKRILSSRQSLKDEIEKGFSLNYGKLISITA